MATPLPSEETLGAFNRFCELLIEGAEKHGVIAVYVFIVFAFMAYLIIKLVRITLKTKDEEIERLVEERNKFQEIVLKERKSSKQTKK